jgi:hypothetical protein
LTLVASSQTRAYGGHSLRSTFRVPIRAITSSTRSVEAR